MNDTDPVRFCFECRTCRPRAGFRPLKQSVPGKPPARWACESCYDKIMAARERVNAR